MNIIFLLKTKSELAYLYSDETFAAGMEKLLSSGYSAIPVIDREGGYVGSVREGDFLRRLAEGDSAPSALADLPIAQILRSDFIPAVQVDAQLGELLTMAQNQNFIPVVDGRGAFIGIVTRKDILQYYYAQMQEG